MEKEREHTHFICNCNRCAENEKGKEKKRYAEEKGEVTIAALHCGNANGFKFTNFLYSSIVHMGPRILALSRDEFLY